MRPTDTHHRRAREQAVRVLSELQEYDKADVANALAHGYAWQDVQCPDEYDMDEYGDQLDKLYAALPHPPIDDNQE